LAFFEHSKAYEFFSHSKKNGRRFSLNKLNEGIINFAPKFLVAPNFE
jgi:hypothetical protein